MECQAIINWLNERLPCRKQTEYNQYQMRPLKEGMQELSVEKWNEIIDFLWASGLNYPIKRTKSTAIAKGPKATLWNCFAWDFRQTGKGLVLTVLVGTNTWVYCIGRAAESNPADTGAFNAWCLFREKCEALGIDLESMKVDEDLGRTYKALTPAPLISMKYEHTKDSAPLDNVHHIDFHNSYPAGLANTHPEFRPIIEEFYNMRKSSPMYKAVLNYTIGCMGSEKHPWHAAWAHLRCDAIENNNKRVESLARRLEKSGREVIGFNTDGIWYRGEVYHGTGEGKGLGEWENDHINCIFRSKSRGAYEYIEDGQYCPVVRGSTTHDVIEPDRTKWTWGDIFKTDIIYWAIDPETGRLNKI